MRYNAMALIAAGTLAIGTLSFAPLSHALDPGTKTPEKSAENRVKNLNQAENVIADAMKVAQKMMADPEMVDLLKKSKGVLIVPKYVRAGLVVGGLGGKGVLLFHRDGKWTSPMIYRIGGVTLGAEVGVEAGALAMLLMNDKAASRAMTDNNFALNADAGFTIADYSARKQVGVEKGDLVVWSDTKGAFAGASISLTDIGFDTGDNEAYYRSKTEITSQRVLMGEVKPPSNALQSLLPN